MPALHIDTSKPVLVTGATGYVAGRVVERLLQEGLTVHATVRDASRTEGFAYLQRLADASPGAIRFFSADLLDPGSFAEGMAGCGVVFHIASPFLTSHTDAQKELIEPALQGTRNVLRSVNETDTVTRVVLTSSCAAIYGSNADLDATPDGVFTEAIWNTSSSANQGAYSYSKTLAEREAWKIHEAQSRWRLVVMNPAMVMGPGVRIHQGSESYSLLKQLGDGTMRTGAPDLGMGVVDVRDLAEAHLRGAFVADAQGRHILISTNTSLPGMARTLLGRWGDSYPIPRRTVPKWLLWLVGPLVNPSLTRDFISRNIGRPWKGDNSKAIRELGMTFRPLEETMNDFFAQLVEAGDLKPS